MLFWKKKEQWRPGKKYSQCIYQIDLKYLKNTAGKKKVKKWAKDLNVPNQRKYMNSQQAWKDYISLVITTVKIKTRAR